MEKIETAPTNGTEIVVFSGLGASVARWDGKGWFCDSKGRYVKATHWQPYIKWPWS